MFGSGKKQYFSTPIPLDMDGKILAEIFNPLSEMTKRKPKYVASSYHQEKTLKGKIFPRSFWMKRVKSDNRMEDCEGYYIA